MPGWLDGGVGAGYREDLSGYSKHNFFFLA